jgi:hypothetical protein
VPAIGARYSDLSVRDKVHTVSTAQRMNEGNRPIGPIGLPITHKLALRRSCGCPRGAPLAPARAQRRFPPAMKGGS